MNNLLESREGGQKNFLDVIINQALREHHLFVLGIFLILQRDRVERLAEEAITDPKNSMRVVSAHSYSLF